MNTPQKSKTIGFWKIYCIVMAVDFLLYVLIFYAGQAIPSSQHTSYPGNYVLVLTWICAHFPTALFFFTQTLSDHLLWLLIFQDAWLAALIYLPKRRKK